jgi:hypothetical protein
LESILIKREWVDEPLESTDLDAIRINATSSGIARADILPL